MGNDENNKKKPSVNSSSNSNLYGIDLLEAGQNNEKMPPLIGSSISNLLEPQQLQQLEKTNYNNQHDSPSPDSPDKKNNEIIPPLPPLPSLQGLPIQNLLKIASIDVDLINDNQGIQNNPLKMEKDKNIPDINPLLDSSIPNDKKFEFNEMVNDNSNNFFDMKKKKKNSLTKDFPSFYNIAYYFQNLNHIDIGKKFGTQNVNVPSFGGIKISTNDGSQIKNNSLFAH